jgi:arylsulfatase
MKGKFDQAAEKYHVYPLDDRGAARLMSPKPPPPGSDPKATTFTYYPGATRLAENAAPPMKNRSWTFTANLDAEGTKTQGVILGFGGVAAGMAAYVKDGVPVFAYNYFEKHTHVKGSKPLPEGKATLQYDFVYAGGGPGKAADLVIKLNGEDIGRGRFEETVAGRFGIDTFGIGEDSGQPVTPDYQPPFKFTGTIEKVTVELK